MSGYASVTASLRKVALWCISWGDMTDKKQSTGQHDPIFWKMPPYAKMFEALTAVADKRVHLHENRIAEVVSSDGSKTYTVHWTEDGSGIVSNDNASYWQGYLGYPILAALMETGRLQFDRNIAVKLSGVEWAKLNKQFKRNYDKAIAQVLLGLEKKGVSRKEILEEVDRLVEQVLHLRLKRIRGTIPPPHDTRKRDINLGTK